MNNCLVHLDCDCGMDVLFRGSTPTYYFTLCLDVNDLDMENTHIMFVCGSGSLDKTGADIDIIPAMKNTVAVSLTQAETMSFSANQLNVQILATLKNGQKPASYINRVPVQDSLRGDIAW